MVRLKLVQEAFWYTLPPSFFHQLLELGYVGTGLSSGEQPQKKIWCLVARYASLERK